MTWRLSFYEGWLHAVQVRLQAARDRALEQVRPSDGIPGAALVLREKADRVQAFHDGASEARGSWRGNQRGDRQHSGRAWAAGERDGRQARLGEPELRDRRALG